MNTLLLVAALGGWNYRGFAGDPAAAVPTPPAPVIRPDRPPVPAAPPVPTPPPPPPLVYRLADATGQVWESTDPDSLRDWVRRRNATLIPVYRPAPAACAGGYCPRR